MSREDDVKYPFEIYEDKDVTIYRYSGHSVSLWARQTWMDENELKVFAAEGIICNKLKIPGNSTARVRGFVMFIRSDKSKVYLKTNFGLSFEA